MKKLRNIALIVGVAALGFGLLARFIPGITITDFVFGFCTGIAVVMFISAIGLAIAPVFCKKRP